MYKIIIGASAYLFLGLFLTNTLYGQNTNEIVTTNVTTTIPTSSVESQNVVTNPSLNLPVQQVPVVTTPTPTFQQVPQQQIPDTGNPMLNTILAITFPLITGGAIWFQQNKKNDNNKHHVEELERENQQLKEGLNRSTQVTTQAVASIAGTDYTNQDIMMIVTALVTQLSKVGVIKPFLEEKIKTNATDLLINNKNIIEASEGLLGSIIADINAYYNMKNKVPTTDDTCNNPFLRNLSAANKMTKKN